MLSTRFRFLFIRNPPKEEKMNWLKRLLGAGEQKQGGTVTVPNTWRVGDGKPFILPRTPNVTEIYAQATPGERGTLSYGYLNHPDPTVRLATITEIGKLGSGYLHNQCLVDRLADTSSAVREAAAQTIWLSHSAVENALSCLRDEIHGSGSFSTMSSEEARKGLETLRKAAPSTEDSAQFENWVREIIG